MAPELLSSKSGIIKNNPGFIHIQDTEQGGTALMKVKVIKKGDVKAAAAPKPEVAATSKKAAAREMVSTVSSWVSDFQQRKRTEAQSLQSFFTPSPAASRP